MRNIDKVIDDIQIPENEPIGERDIRAIANLIACRNTEHGRAELIDRCAHKFNIEKYVLEKKVKHTLEYMPAKSPVTA
jgi:hypothetical protein